MIYSKAATTIEEQIVKLQKRGLIIADESVAKHFLLNVGYYRLAGYWWPMQSDKVNHTFKPNSRFEDVIALYNFDRELRLLVFDVIERIEVGLRTKLIYHLSHEFDPWWFQDPNLFVNIPELIRTLNSIVESIERSKDVFIQDHKKRYKNEVDCTLHPEP
jgi:abortive infection bacteriophage resistance protein